MKGIKPRRYGTNPGVETRVEAHENVDKRKRYKEIIGILQDINRPMSAKEIAVEMYRRGYTPTAERNFSHPRINELLHNGRLEIYGKGTCRYTHKTVSYYVLREKDE